MEDDVDIIKYLFVVGYLSFDDASVLDYPLVA